MSLRSSARLIIDNAGRSFTERAGVLPSSLTRIVLPRPAPMRCRRTSGVLPTVSSSILYMVISGVCGLGQQMFAIFCDAGRDVAHFLAIARLAQAADIGAGIGLVFTLERIGERNVFDDTLLVEFG